MSPGYAAAGVHAESEGPCHIQSDNAASFRFILVFPIRLAQQMRVPRKDHLFRVEHAGRRLFAIVDDVQTDSAVSGAFRIKLTLAAANISLVDECYWVTEVGDRVPASIVAVRTGRVTKITLRACGD